MIMYKDIKERKIFYKTLYGPFGHFFREFLKKK